MNNTLEVTSKVKKIGVWHDLPSDSINAIELNFVFDDEWDDLVCTAQFMQGTTTYNQLITDGKCLLPSELNVGKVKISVFGAKTDGTAFRATTVPFETEIIQSGFDGTGQTPIPPTPDLYEQLIEEFSNGGVHTLNNLKSDISLVDGDNTTVVTDTDENKISVNVIVDSSLSDSSENAVQNKVVKGALDNKLSLNGGTMSGNVDFGNTYHITGLDAPNNDHDATNKKYVDSADALAEKIANKVTEFTGDETDTEYPSAKLVYDTIVDIASQFNDALDDKEDKANKVTSLSAQSTDTEYPSAKCVYDGLNTKFDKTGGTISGGVSFGGNAVASISTLTMRANGTINMSSGKITNLSDPSASTDAATKNYVDTAIANALIVDTEEEIP